MSFALFTNDRDTMRLFILSVFIKNKFNFDVLKNEPQFLSVKVTFVVLNGCSLRKKQIRLTVTSISNSFKSFLREKLPTFLGILHNECCLQLLVVQKFYFFWKRNGPQTLVHLFLNQKRESIYTAHFQP